MTRGLVHIAGSERRVLSHPGSPTSQTILEICIQRGGISIQDPAVLAIPGSPHFYTAHGCGSLSSVTDGNPRTQLPRRLAHSGLVCTLVGSASYVTHPVLAEAEGSIRGLASWMLPRNNDLGLCISPGPLEGPLLAKAMRDPRHGAQKEGCHDRCFQ